MVYGVTPHTPSPHAKPAHTHRHARHTRHARKGRTISRTSLCNSSELRRSLSWNSSSGVSPSASRFHASARSHPSCSTPRTAPSLISGSEPCSWATSPRVASLAPPRRRRLCATLLGCLCKPSPRRSVRKEASAADAAQSTDVTFVTQTAATSACRQPGASGMSAPSGSQPAREGMLAASAL